MTDLKTDDISDEEIEDAILWKFFRMRAGKSRHIYESDIHKGMPPHLHKIIMNQVKELRRKGLLVEFPHGREHVFTLNMNRIIEIKERLRKRYQLV